MLFHMYAILDMPFQQKELYLWLINAGAVRQFLSLDSYYIDTYVLADTDAPLHNLAQKDTLFV